MNVDEFISSIRQAAAKRILYLPHTLQQIAKPERMITTDEIRSVIDHGEVIEDYPNDARLYALLKTIILQLSLHIYPTLFNGTLHLEKGCDYELSILSRGYEAGNCPCTH